MAGAGLVSTAGCIDRLGTTDSSKSPSPTAENGQTSTTISKSSSTESHTLSPTNKGTSGPPLSYRIKIENGGTHKLELKVLLSSSTGERRHAKTYMLEPGEDIKLDEYISSDMDYRIELIMDEKTIFKHSIGEYESYVVAVYPNGTARVVEHVEV